jgi:hypothetical protein
VNFGSSPLEPQPLDEDGKPKGGYVNRRAEMWGKSKEWLQEPAGVIIPDDDALHADGVAPGYKYDSLTRVLLESKDDIRRRGLPSPDDWDALALTFAEPVRPAAQPIKYPTQKVRVTDKPDTDGPMTDEELATALAEMNRSAVGYLTDEVAVDQDDNLDRYLGKPYGDEEDGSSTAMSMDVAEVVDWALA